MSEEAAADAVENGGGGPGRDRETPAQDADSPAKAVYAERLPSRWLITVADADPVVLRPGEWSDWISFSFSMGLARSCSTCVKIYLHRLDPEFGLYIGACQIDPSDPAFPITYPKAYAEQLVKEIGPYHTMGIPEEYSGVMLGVIPLPAFLEKCGEITSERNRMLAHELASFNGGLLAVVFETNDRISHFLWPTVAPSHPAHNQFMEAGFGDVIPIYYRLMDAMVGKVLDSVGEDIAVIVMSDHGFASSLYTVNINNWLKDNGYLIPTTPQGKADPTTRADWSRTKAYSVGSNGLYLNVQGREAQGIISEGEEYQQVREEIIRKLRTWTDPRTGKPIMRNVYAREEVYQGSYLDQAPDVVLGYYPEYTTSIGSALGNVLPGNAVNPIEPFHWLGNHMVDPSCVPGVFLSNFKINTDHPSLIDICPTVLRCFNVPAPHDTDGKALF